MTIEFSKHGKALGGFANRLANGRWDVADDLLQQTFLQAWRNKHRVDYSRCCKPWLMRIMKNEFLQMRRRSVTHEELCEDTFSASHDFSSSALTHLEFLDLLKSMSKLKADQRQAILLVLAQGYTYEEAAQMLGSRAGTIKSRVARAREKLTEMHNSKAAA